MSAAGMLVIGLADREPPRGRRISSATGARSPIAIASPP